MGKWLLFWFFYMCAFASDLNKLPAETHIKTTQQYNSTISYIIYPKDLEKNSMYEIKIHSLGSIPTLYGVSLFQPKQYSTNSTFLDESNLQFITNNDGCVVFENKIECQELKCHVTLLYMGRTTHKDELDKGVTYFITLKRGKWGLPGNVPTLICLGIICIIIAAVATFMIIKQFNSVEETGKKN